MHPTSPDIRRSPERMPSPQSARLLRDALASEHPEEHVQAILRSGSSELIREQRERARAAWDGEAHAAIDGFRTLQASLPDRLANAAFPDLFAADIERMVDEGAQNPYDNERHPLLVRQRGGTEEQPNLQVSVDAIEQRLRTIAGYRNLPGMTPEQSALLDDIAARLQAFKELDPVATEEYRRQQMVLNAPHQKFAGKLGKYSLLLLGGAAAAFGVAHTVVNFMSKNEEDRKPSPLLLGPLVAWALLNWKSLGKRPPERMMDQLSVLNHPRMKTMLTGYAGASPDGFAAIAERIMGHPQSPAIRALLKEPGSAQARRDALDELMPQGTDERARASLSAMMADNRFAEFHTLLRKVTHEDAKEFVADFIRTKGFQG